MKSLTTDVFPEEMRALSQRRRNGEFGSSWLGSLGSVLPFAMVAGFALLFLDGAMRWVVLAGAVLVGAGVVGWAWWRDRTGTARWAKLARFADENNLSYRLMSEAPNYPGLLFDIGDRRQASHHVFSQSGAFADAGDYE